MRFAALAVACAMAGCAHSPPDDPQDPLEPANRAIYTFNETADRYVLRPIAVGYDKVTPDPVQAGIGNFFSNLSYPVVIANDLLQGKVVQAGQDFSRFVLNSTFGIIGIFDIASPTGLPEHDEDFGQTLGYWGVGPGWYLMLPFFGPSDNRDLVGRGVDVAASPTFYVQDSEANIPLGIINAVDGRARLLQADRFLAQQLDRYVFVRSIYLQNRLNKVHDGNPPKEDFGFDEDDPDAAAEAAADAQALKEAAEEE